jgi:uncharacterized protein (TIGR01777 family)
MPGPKRVTWHEIEKNGIPGKTQAVVNLAGQNVLDPTRRWTPGFKQNVWNSRIHTTSLLARTIERAQEKPEVFINISGVSAYKPDSNRVYTEEDDGTEFDFMSKLCLHWEQAATLSKDCGVRNVKIRTGVVLGREGGMIASLIFPFWFGMGGPIGDGKQYLPWIHIVDLCNLIVHSIENKQVSGVLNGTAPQIITNLEFSKAFAKALIRPALIPLPELAVNIIFGKERGVIMTTGAKIQPKRTLESGFKYEFPEIYDACKDVGTLFVY